VGEAGKDNTFSLAHLHSILPLMIGPEQQDFFLLVLQCPPDDRAWRFKPTKDGNLDVVLAATDHVIKNNPIDRSRLSIFGLSSGGSGTWEWLKREPDKFAAAVPVACGAPYDFQKLGSLAKTAIWTFYNKGDKNAPIESIHKAMQVVNGSGGFMKQTQFDQGGHAAWRPAMDEYNCFAWMITQKRGSWFNPPPERKVYQYRSLTNSFFAFFLPLGLAAGLFVFQRSPYCERLRERVHGRIVELLTPHNLYVAKQNEENTDAKSDDFRIWSDTAGTKQFKGNVVDFQGDNQVRIQTPEGKIATMPIKQFCTADQELIRKIQDEQPLPEGFRRWAKFDGSQSAVAKFVGFQPDGKAMLQSPTGKTLAVPINQFGQAEQDFLAQQQK
jgi:pimeloyl-ACP methyl ester carboxylesterase